MIFDLLLICVLILVLIFVLIGLNKKSLILVFILVFRLLGLFWIIKLFELKDIKDNLLLWLIVKLL